MSLWSRFANLFRGESLRSEIDEELELHIAEAVEEGRDPLEARRAFGSALRRREESHEIRLISRLESLRADAVFGWRQLTKRKVTSAAAVLSLALGIGACIGAFRLIDALLLRPLPVAHPERLYDAAKSGVGPDGRMLTYDAWAYPAFQLMRAAVKDHAELIAVSYAERTDVTYASDQEIEKAQVQYVSGWMFAALGLRPAVGRLFTAHDDTKPGGHPYAIISDDYWKSRFARDPKIVGRTFRMAGHLYQIMGVVEAPFTGTEPGIVTAVFVPTMMHPAVVHDDWTWHRTFVQLKPGAAVEPVRAVMHATSRAFEEERSKGFKGMSRESIEKFLDQTVVLLPAAGGASGLQEDYRTALLALGVLVALVLLIACANVANLLSAQAASRAREMALRVSIGAGRSRLVQLLLVESAIIAFLSSALGLLFAWWSAPYIVARINPPDNPARLDLPVDWRMAGFALALTLGVTVLFGLGPALRASAVSPAGALKGGLDPHARRRSMHALIALQAAFCFIVLFLAGLFVTTFDRLSHRPTGFQAARLLNVETVTAGAQPPAYWDQIAERLRAIPGVQSVGIAGWPLLAGGAWNGFVSVNGAPPGPVLAYFLSVSPGWLETVKIPLVDGRDFRPSENFPGAALVNETFTKQFLTGLRPLGVNFAKETNRDNAVVGVVRDAPYRDLREATLPVAYVPLHSLDEQGRERPLSEGTFVVRTTAANPMAIASILRREVQQARPGFRVSNIRTQQEIDDSHTIRERVLAMLALFFGVVALLLAAVGLYGVLDYSVLRRRREIGIRMAIGARPAGIARLVTLDVFVVVLSGAVAGSMIGTGTVHYVESLLYQVKATSLTALGGPSLVILGAALLAAVPAVIRAVRLDPVTALREE